MRRVFTFELNCCFYLIIKIKLKQDHDFFYFPLYSCIVAFPNTLKCSENYQYGQLLLFNKEFSNAYKTFLFFFQIIKKLKFKAKIFAQSSFLREFQQISPKHTLTDVSMKRSRYL